MGRRGPFLWSLDTHLPWSKEGVCPREAQEGPAEVGRAATGGSRNRAQGLLQLLGHLAGQLFSPSGSYVRRGLSGLSQPLGELQDAKTPGQICQFS